MLNIWQERWTYLRNSQGHAAPSTHLVLPLYTYMHQEQIKKEKILPKMSSFLSSITARRKFRECFGSVLLVARFYFICNFSTQEKLFHSRTNSWRTILIVFDVSNFWYHKDFQLSFSSSWSFWLGFLAMNSLSIYINWFSERLNSSSLCVTSRQMVFCNTMSCTLWKFDRALNILAFFGISWCTRASFKHVNFF